MEEYTYPQSDHEILLFPILTPIALLFYIVVKSNTQQTHEFFNQSIRPQRLIIIFDVHPQP